MISSVEFVIDANIYSVHPVFMNTSNHFCFVVLSAGLPADLVADLILVNECDGLDSGHPSELRERDEPNGVLQEPRPPECEELNVVGTLEQNEGDKICEQPPRAPPEPLLRSHPQHNLILRDDLRVP